MSNDEIDEQPASDHTPVSVRGFVGTRQPAEAVHLGDGAYATFDGYHIVLTANHHDPRMASDRVSLEPGTIEPLLRYIARFWRA